MNAKEKILKMEPLSSPVSDMIASIGEGLARAQIELDKAALQTIERIYYEPGGASEALREIGYQPTWYQIPEMTAELKMAMTIEGERTPSTTRRRAFAPRILGAPVDANYSNKFNYKVEGSSTINFKIVPIPPPSASETLMPVAVPDLKKSSAGEAIESLKGRGLTHALRKSGSSKEESDTAANLKKEVTSQDPEPGSRIRRGSTVRLTIKK